MTIKVSGHPATTGSPSLFPRRDVLERVDVIGIGVQKSATSWLFRCLAEHPEVRTATSPRGSDKELNFFNHAWERGYAWYHQNFHFGPWKTAEFSVLYFHDRSVPERIARYNPDVRLLLSVRNPIDRAFSQHRHEIRRGRIGPERYNFWTALQDNPSYIEQGLYARHLEEWLRFFDLDQILVIDYGDILLDPASVIDRVFKFVGVQGGIKPRWLDQRVNVSVMTRSESLSHYLKAVSRLLTVTVGQEAVRRLKGTALGRRVREINRIEVDERFVAPLSSDDRRRLREYFLDDIALLQRLLGRDFSHWK